MGKGILNQCRSEGLSCSSVLRAARVWHFSGAGSYGTRVSRCARCQHREQMETAPVLTITAATSMITLLKMIQKAYVWFVSEWLWVYVLLLWLVLICLFCAAGGWVGERWWGWWSLTVDFWSSVECRLVSVASVEGCSCILSSGGFQ